MTAKRQIGTATRLYLRSIISVSALLTGVSVYELATGRTGDESFLLVGLSALIGLSNVRLLQLRLGARISAQAAPQFAAAVLLSPAGATVVTALGVSAGYMFQIVRGRQTRTDLLFHAAQSVLSTLTAAGLYRFVSSVIGNALAEPLALVAAGAGMYATNALLVAIAMALSHQDSGVLSTWSHLLRHDPLVYTVLLVIGLLTVLLTRENNFWAVPLLIGPIALTEHVVIRQHEESERERKIAVMEEVDEHRREFVAAVTHDLRTPLMTIKGFAELLADREDEFMPDERTAISAINASAEQLAEQIETLLQLSEIDAGILRFDPCPSDVEPLIGRVFDQLRYSAGIKRVNLRLETPRPLPPVVLDPRRIEQVLNNVVGNAIKFAPAESTVVVNADVDNDTLMITIADAGPGIAPEVLPHIFERFYRTPESDTGRRRTGGLGLAIAKSIVELHGGTISAWSALRLGSIFTIRLPVSRPYPSVAPRIARALPNER